MTTLNDGSATLNDFTPVSQVVTFGPSNAGAKSIPIPINNDALVEGIENFSVLLTTTDSNVDIEINKATVNILDDDSK